MKLLLHTVLIFCMALSAVAANEFTSSLNYDESRKILRHREAITYTWTSQGIDRIRINLIKNSVFYMAVDVIDNNGSYTWNLSDRLPPGTFYQLQFSNIDNPQTMLFSFRFDIALDGTLTAGRIPRYRLFNATDSKHHYTTDSNEADSLAALG